MRELSFKETALVAGGNDAGNVGSAGEGLPEGADVAIDYPEPAGPGGPLTGRVTVTCGGFGREPTAVSGP